MKKLLVPAAVLAAVAAAAGPFLDREETLRRVVVGMAAPRGWAPAGPIEKACAAAWESGGWLAADLCRAAIPGVTVFLALMLAGIFLARLPERWRAPGHGIFLAIATLVFALGLWNARSVSQGNLRDPRLLAPVDLLARASRLEGRIFFDAHSLFLAPLFAPQKIEPDSSPQQSARLSASPAEWRARDRESPFAAVVLSGQNDLAGPLVEMLRALPGWNVEVSDNHGLLLARSRRRAEQRSPSDAPPRFSNPRDEAVYLSRSALVQHVAGNPAAATDLLRKAMDLDQTHPAVPLSAGLVAAREGRWREARGFSESALALQPGSLQAAHLLALSLLESGAVSRAADLIAPLAAKYPNDPALLGLQARIARENNDPATETEALEKLLSLSNPNAPASARLHALLGEAWARRGFPDKALENLNAALAADPAPDERQSLEEKIDLLRRSVR